MSFDFKKEYKEFYIPKNKPAVVTVPKANYIAVRGKGNPNDEGGAYQQAMSILYSVAYTLKMSYKTDYRIEGFFDYVVPPLEGFWWQEGIEGIDYSAKSTFCWISVIRLPDFVTEKDLEWAVETASRKKKLDCSKAGITGKMENRNQTSYQMQIIYVIMKQMSGGDSGDTESFESLNSGRRSQHEQGHCILLGTWRFSGDSGIFSGRSYELSYTGAC